MELIERPLYLNRLKAMRLTPDIKIITGIRRSGKSKLMLLYMQYLKEIDHEANIIFVDFRALDSEPLLEYHALNRYVEEHYMEDKHNYLCIDEIQLCQGFERTIDSLHTSEKYDIYLTGSNAFLLSSDLATLFTGRYMEVEVLPFSMEEYRVYYASSNDVQQDLLHYTAHGGFSGSYQYTDETDKIRYIKGVYDTIIQRDLVEKYHLPNDVVLYQVAEFMMDNIGNILSPHGISHTLTSNGISISHVTVGQYISYLTRAFLFYSVRRYDIRGKKYLQSLHKYYLADSGLRYAILGKRNMDWGRIFENLVYLELRRRGYEIYVGKLYQKEIDFVAMRGGEKLFIQVSDDISNPDTFKREYTPLLQIKEAYPKIIIACTKHPQYDYQGIQIVDLATWLAKP